MPKGALQELFLQNASAPEALSFVAQALKASKFKILESHDEDGRGFLKAVWGSKLKSYFVGNLPLGKLFKSGKRLGAEVEVSQQAAGTAVRILIVPYMELFNRPEVFLISQGILEKLTDDSFSAKKMGEVLSHLQTPNPGTHSNPGVHSNPGPKANPQAYEGHAQSSAPMTNPSTASPAYDAYIQPTYRERRGGAGFWFLGLAAASAILYYFFVYAPRQYTTQEFMLIGLGALFAGGFIARKGTRGALLGFLLPFVPLLVLGILVLMGSLSGAGDAQGLEVLGPVIGVVAGAVLLGMAFVAGIIGLLVGGLAGWISGKLFPLQSRF